jgi:hypothetical protein
MATTINASTSTGLIQTADTSGVLQLQSAGTTILQANSASATGLLGGIIQPYQYYQLNAASTGSNVSTAQSMFGVGVTLAASKIYEFEIMSAISLTAGATSHTIATGFGGTATLNNIGYQAYIVDDTSFIGTSNTSHASRGNYISAATATVLCGSSTATNYVLMLKGTVSVNAAGTFIPQYTFSAAPGGTPSTQIGSYFKISQLAASGANVNIGTWS